MSFYLGDTVKDKVDFQAIKKNRVIRVFISSTFKDMKKERDQLIKYTFPELRKMCEERGVNWSEVDLRWGVTNEQSADGQVLPICLAEIENCLPFFIGILGERYGWIPEISSELIQKYPWLDKHVGKSVTELEILQGALLHENKHMNAFFYFRSPDYINTLSEEEHVDFLETIESDTAKYLSQEEIEQELSERKGKLENLKNRIRNSGYYLGENFSDSKELGNMVFSDMSKLIDELFPKHIPEDELERRANEHETFALTKAKFFVGREKYLEKMTEYIYKDDNSPLVITGDSGSGKSSLLSYWSLNQAQNLEGTHIPTIMHFIGAGSVNGDISNLMRRMIMELNRKFHLGMEIPFELDELREAFALSLDLAAEHGKVIIVLDSIDQLNLTDSSESKDLFWLPTKIPANIRLILSTTKGEELQEFINREWTILELDLLVEKERKLIINNYFSAFGKNLEQHILESILYHPLSSNPLFLRTLLDEIRVDGDKGLYEKVLSYVNSVSIEDLFLKKIERIETDYGHEKEGLVKDALSLLWGARVGLSESEISDLLGTEEEKVASSIWSPFYLAMESNLVVNTGFICLFHQFFRDAVEKKYLSSEEARKANHRKIAEYFSKEKDTLKNRVLQELPWQWTKAGEWKELFHLFQDFNFLLALWKYDPFMLKSYWASIEENTKPWKQNFTEELTMLKAYRQVIDYPELFKIEEIKLVAKLLEGKYIDEALVLQNYMRNYFEEHGQVSNLLKCQENISNLYRMKSEYHLAMKLLKEQETIAREKNVVEMIQSSLGNQAEILTYWGEYDQAMLLLKQQEEICRFELDNKFGLQQSIGNQARIKYYQMDYEEGLKLLNEKERICQATNNKGGLQEAIGQRGLIFKAQNKLDDALELFELQEEISRSIGNMKDLQDCLSNQAATLYQKSPTNKEAIIAILREQELICYYIDHKDGLQSNYGLLARLLPRNSESSLNMLKKQEKICRELDNKLSLQECLGRQAFILKNKNQYDKALDLLNEQEKICRTHGYLMGLQISLGNKAMIAKQFGQIYQALEYTTEQEEICESLEIKRGLFYSYGMKSWILKRFGKLDEALDYNLKQEQLAIELEFIEGYCQALYEQANIFAMKADYEKALSLYEKCQEKVLDEKNLNHTLLKQEKIKQIIENGPEHDDEEFMDLHSISPLEVVVLKIIEENDEIVFEPLINLVNSDDQEHVTKKELQKLLYILKKKALIFSFKNRIEGKIKTVYKVSDFGLDRILEMTGEISNKVHSKKESVKTADLFEKERITDTIVAVLKPDYLNDNHVLVDEERQIVEIKNTSSIQYIICVDHNNLHEMSDHLDYLHNKTNHFYLVAKTEQLLHEQAIIEFYKWLKQKYKKIKNASNLVDISISFIDKMQEATSEEEIWKRLKF
ncbi:DUF4062 domain-containing protein [Metabacillus bambusae]|uniref:DUF4062 domain-containing protein n=1 Tax=Metabacillus bambusae TaxID=2795218 RepID=A0ABS3N7S5_9BACI|nr:DUF4062 domain-containing protein [Metabacillus bambusae]MBO1514352.1 DUF4062 domain-containing protein [Metabacillus bambusae]